IFVTNHERPLTAVRHFRSRENTMKKTQVLLSLFTLSWLVSTSLPAAASIVLSPERSNHTAILLSTGKVLIAGGGNESGNLNSTLLYDPAAGTLAATGALVTARSDHAASLLND